MISELLLDFIPNTSCKLFTVKDVSLYNENLPVTCGLLEIKAPGFTYVVNTEVERDFEQKVTMSFLQLQSQGAKYNNPLPDGNYEIKYSINPNEVLFVEYNYYSTCNLYNNYISQLCDYFNKSCELTQAEQEKEMERLFEISTLLDNVKISAQECNDVPTADRLYEKAKQLLEKHGCNFNK